MTVLQELENAWRLGVISDRNGVTLLDENGKPFATARSSIPGSATGQAGAAARLLKTLEANRAKNG